MAAGSPSSPALTRSPEKRPGGHPYTRSGGPGPLERPGRSAMNGNPDLFNVVRSWVEANYPGESAETLVIHIRGRAVPVQLPVPPALVVNGRAVGPPPFITTSFQDDILEALDGRALKTDALGAAVGDRGRLYRARGLKELREKGMVCHEPGVGFYRPDAPPKEWGTKHGHQVNARPLN